MKNFFKEAQSIEGEIIRWRSVKKIGNDMIIIEYDGVY